MIHGSVSLKIPTSVGLISFALVGTACSDHYRLSRAYEKVCKANCECPDELEDWNDVKNCKDACEGYADAQKALFKDEFEDREPCDGLKEIAKKIEDCADRGCQGIYECVYELSDELFACLGYDSYNYYYGFRNEERQQSIAIREELTTQLLYGPVPLECSPTEPDRSDLCEVMGFDGSE